MSANSSIQFTVDSSAYGINGRPPCPNDHLEFFGGLERERVLHSENYVSLMFHLPLPPLLELFEHTLPRVRLFTSFPNPSGYCLHGCACVIYSGTSDNEHSDEQTTSHQWTNSVPPADNSMQSIHSRPPTKGHLQPLNNGQKSSPQLSLGIHYKLQ